MRAVAKPLAALCLAAALPAGAAGAAEPWSGPVDPAGEGALARCAAFYAFLSPGLAEDGRRRTTQASERLIGALDAQDRASRGEPAPETPRPRQAVLDEVLTAVERYRATLEAGLTEVGEEDVRGFIATEAERCEQVARGQAAGGAPSP